MDLSPLARAIFTRSTLADVFYPPLPPIASQSISGTRLFPGEHRKTKLVRPGAPIIVLGDGIKPVGRHCAPLCVQAARQGDQLQRLPINP